MVQVTANGLQIEVEETGPANAPAILLIHGWGCQLVHWQDSFFQGLAAKGYRVIRFDNRDIGKSTWFDDAGLPDVIDLIMKAMAGESAEAPYYLGDMARDAVGVLDALKIERAHVVGASMGGMIAQLVAAQFPDRVKSLTPVMTTSGDPSLPNAEDEVMGAMMAPPPDPADREACVSASMTFWRMIGSPDYAATEAELRAKAERAYDRAHHPDGGARQLAAIVASGSRSEILPTITAPTRVVHGEADRLIPIACGRDVARLIPGAQMREIAGMGHDFTEALTPVYLREIGGFIDEVEGR